MERMRIILNIHPQLIDIRKKTLTRLRGGLKVEIKNIIKQMISKYGEKQLIVAIEELSELQKEVCKDLRGKGDREHIIEEMADVQLVLDELKEYYGISQEEIYRIKRAKMLRTEKRYLEDGTPNEEKEKEKTNEQNLFDLAEVNND